MSREQDESQDPEVSEDSTPGAVSELDVGTAAWFIEQYHEEGEGWFEEEVEAAYEWWIESEDLLTGEDPIGFLQHLTREGYDLGGADAPILVLALMIATAEDEPEKVLPLIERAIEELF